MPRSFYRQRGPVLPCPRRGGVCAVWAHVLSPRCALAVAVGGVAEGGELIGCWEIDVQSTARIKAALVLLDKRLEEAGWGPASNVDIDEQAHRLWEDANNLEIVEVRGRTWEL
jgi:hypothetical protein